MNTDRLYKRGIFLTSFLAAYNILEGIASILFGAMAGSIALTAFGLDSVVEVFTNSIVIYHLRQHERRTKEIEEKAEKRIVKIIAVTFFVLAAYVLYESVTKLIFREIPDPSLPGIIIALASVVIMPLFAMQTRKVGKQINSQALIADSSETMACMFLSVALLLGLGMNYLFGFWQADPIVGLIIVAFLIKEGWENWQESSEENEEGGYCWRLTD